MYASSLDLICAWQVSRLSLWRYVPLSMLIAGAAWAGGSAGSLPVLASMVLAFMLTAQFRLWDDLVDRARDRQAHPLRVVVNAESTTAFVRVLVALGMLNVLGLGLISGIAAAVVLLGLVALLALWYWAHHGRGLIHIHALLLKYPCFVVLLATAPHSRADLALAASSVYAAMCAFDLLDDPQHRGRATCIALASHCGALSLAPLVATQDRWSLVATLMLLPVLAAAWWRWRTGGSAGVLRYLPFVASALTVSLIALRGTP